MADIIPTIGRIILYYPSEADLDGYFLVKHGEQPFKADVIFVHGDRLVNLNVTDHEGHVQAFEKVQLVQEGDAAPVEGGYCAWMRYQKDVASGTTKPNVHA